MGDLLESLSTLKADRRMAHLERRYGVPQAAGNSSSLASTLSESPPI
tara:strand:- start:40752 stop:40892 length:141 start_codon:yes stop_codon:yes gene_type:complete